MDPGPPRGEAVPSPAPGRARRWIVRAALALAALPIAYLVVLNGFLNFVLPGALSRSPERFRARWAFAWMWVPGRVATARGVVLEGRDAGGAWSLSARRAAGDLDLARLGERRLVLRGLTASGVRFAVDREQAGGAAGRRSPWTVDVEGVVDADRISVDALGFAGELHVAGHLVLADTVDATLESRIADGTVSWRGATTATAVAGPIGLTLEGLPRKGGLDRATWTHVSGRTDVSAEIEGFSFLDPYLERVPWLSVVGSGAVSAEVEIRRGEFQPGSVAEAATRDLHVGFLSYDVAGDGSVHLEVTEGARGPTSALDVGFGAFVVTGAPVAGVDPATPLVRGTGFALHGESAMVSLAEPLDAVDLALELPPSEAPDLAVYNAWLPTDVGMALTGGRGSVRGELRANTRDGLARGEVVLAGDEVTARFEDLVLTFDFALRAVLREGNLGEHTYDFGGTTLEVEALGLRDTGPPPSEEEGPGPDWSEARDWWVTVAVPRGRAMVGRQEYLEASVTLAAADSAPFVRLVSQRKPLPDWVQKALAIPDVAGSGDLRLGIGAVRLDPLALRAGKLTEVGLRLRLTRDDRVGALYAAYGNLSVGLRLDGDTRELVPFGSRKWFAGLPPDLPSAAATAPAPSKVPVIRWVRKPKPEPEPAPGEVAAPEPAKAAKGKRKRRDDGVPAP